MWVADTSARCRVAPVTHDRAGMTGDRESLEPVAAIGNENGVESVCGAHFHVFWVAEKMLGGGHCLIKAAPGEE